MATAATKQHDQLIIVGSGPIGMAAALAFKDHFKKITLLERQTKDGFLQKNGFTFPIVFTTTAIRLLEHIGVWDDLMSERSEYYGVVMHRQMMGEDRTFSNERRGIYSHWRSHIINVMHNHISRVDNIDIQFQANVTHIDFDNNICTEDRLGDVKFDMLMGSDGINSITRRMMAKVHPKYSEDQFKLDLLDRWVAYLVPATGKMGEAFGGGERHLASHIYMDNIADYPDEKFRIISTHMRYPKEEINMLIKYDASMSNERVKEINMQYFSQYYDSMDELEAAWDEAISGKFQQVITPTYSLNSVILMGDAAHGFSSSGDLINVGVGSLHDFYKIFLESNSIPEAIETYDATVGESVRDYSKYTHRRGREKTKNELLMFRLAGKYGLVGKHPSFGGVRAPNFDMQQMMNDYKKDLRKIRMLFYGIPAAIIALIVLLILSVIVF